LIGTGPAMAHRFARPPCPQVCPETADIPESMERGLYIAAAGMVAEMVRQDQIANDMANAATPGYKSDRSQQKSFSDLMLQNTETGQAIGKLGQGPIIAKQVTDLSQEPLRYTRNGSFKASATSVLTDQLGNPVLDANRRPLKVAADGTVDVKSVGLFGLTNVRKQGDALFTGTAAGKADGEVQSGVLEGSGVDAGRTMVNMIASLRAFEAGQKAITTIDSTLQQAASQVGNLPG
jgi:flagellar basal-body rod protein FlgF